jgi:hypothetical protein
MKWEKEKFEDLDETLVSLNKLKALAKIRLNTTKEKLKTVLNEMPEYAELYKKMKGL